MGEMEVPADALYGASTQRAVLNFPISGQRFPRPFIRALALIKGAAAETNVELGLLEPDVGAAIAAAAAEVGDGAHDEQFPIDIYQTGSGTSTNTNMNEVLAHLATARLAQDGAGGSKVHPNDHVNRSQSSNDVIPTALQLAAAMRIEEALLPALDALRTALDDRATALWPVVKTGRTHLQDATPIRLGQEFRGYAGQVEESIRRARAAQGELLSVPLGGTAVGTGINAHPEFASGATRRLAARTGLEVHETSNHFHAQATLDAAIAAHGAIRTIALSLWKIGVRRPAARDGTARRPGGDRAAGDPAGLVDHAGQGEPGHRREPDDGRGPGRRQRRDDRLRADGVAPRAQRDAAGDGSGAPGLHRAARRRGPRTSPIAA